MKYPTYDNFRVAWRNNGHWDIYDVTTEKRLFTIRGEPGNVWIQDHRNIPYPVTKGFIYVNSAMSFICDILMQENEES